MPEREAVRRLLDEQLRVDQLSQVMERVALVASGDLPKERRVETKAGNGRDVQRFPGGPADAIGASADGFIDRSRNPDGSGRRPCERATRRGQVAGRHEGARDLFDEEGISFG